MKKIRILSWNVNGFRAVYKKGFMDWLHKESPDILCLQETKAEEEQIQKELKDVEGYHWVFCSSQKKKGYSGVAIFSKEKPTAVAKGFGHDPFDSEGRTIVAAFPGFTLCNVYFPNGKASPERLKYKMDFYRHFQDYTAKLRKQGQSVIVCGDVNTAHKEIDLARPKENSTVSGFLPEERAWLTRVFDELGFVDVFRRVDPRPEQYTWWSNRGQAWQKNVGWRIDYQVATPGIAATARAASIYTNRRFSDHAPLIIDYDFELR